MYLEHAQGGIAYDGDCVLILHLCDQQAFWERCAFAEGAALTNSTMHEAALLRIAVR